MKKVIRLLVVSLVLLACNNDDNPVSTISITDVNNTVSSGTWKITYYWDSNHDETSNFTGYVFTFGGGSVLTAVKAGASIAGNWTTGNDDSKVKLFISFTAPPNFVEISDDWHVTERTDTRIKLQDISGGNGGTDLLTFEKN